MAIKKLTQEDKNRIKNNNYTMLPPKCLEVLMEQYMQAPEDGIIVVAGTAHGGDIMEMRRRNPNRYIIAIDSFEGIGERIDKDQGVNSPRAGAHNCGGLTQYKNNFKDAEIKLPDSIYKMWITLENLQKKFKKKDLKKIAMLWMDLDCYIPTKACLEFFSQYFEKDSVVITHDYGFERNPGVKTACQEFAPGDWKLLYGTTAKLIF